MCIRDRIEINIDPPFWQTKWFLSLVLLSLVLLGAGIFQFLLRQKIKKQKEKLKEQEEKFKRQRELDQLLQQERNRIAADMHDDLGGGLNSIRLLSRALKKELGKGENTKRVNKIENKASDLVGNMRAIVWAMDSSQDSLSELVAHIRRYTADYFDDHELSYNFPIPENLPELIVSGKRRRNVFLCIKEGAHNIIKHAQAKEAILSFHYDEEKLIISLKDNGIGMPAKKRQHYSKGLSSMYNRMEQIGGKLTILQKNGTELLFNIPLPIENPIDHPIKK